MHLGRPSSSLVMLPQMLQMRSRLFPEPLLSPYQSAFLPGLLLRLGQDAVWRVQVRNEAEARICVRPFSLARVVLESVKGVQSSVIRGDLTDQDPWLI